jgi:hypothetical protein
VLSKSERSLRARLGGLALAASHDPAEYTAAGRAVFLARFEQEVDPERQLAEPERQRRALSARRAYFARLAFKSAVARSRRNSRPRR